MTVEETSALLRPENAALPKYATDGQPLPVASDTPPADDTTSSSVEGDVEQQVSEPGARAYLTIIMPLAMGVFLSAMDGTIVVTSYAAIGSEMHQLQNTSWIATSYLLTMTTFQPLYGKLSDIFGRKNCLLVCFVIFGLGCFLCGISRNMTELIAARAFSGIGGAGLQTLTSIIVSDTVPLRVRGTWQGVLNIIWAVGNAFGASAGGFLADTIGWRWGFHIQVPISFLAFLSVLLSLHLPTREIGDFHTKIRRLDFAGAVTLIVTVFSLLFAFDRGGNIGWNDRITQYSLLTFAIFGSLFAFVEMEWAREPFAPKRIIVNRSLIASYMVNLLGMASFFSIMFHIPLYLQAVHSKSASETSMWLILCTVGAVAGSLAGGLIIQATGKYYWLTVSTYALHFLGTLLLALTCGVLVTSIVLLTIGLLASCVGNSTGITTSLISLIANAGPEDQAIATAVSYLFRSLGSVVGLSTGSTIVQMTLRSTLLKRLDGDQDVDEIVRRVRESLTYLDELEPAVRDIVRGSYATAIQAAFGFCVIISALCFFSSVWIKEKPLSSKK